MSPEDELKQIAKEVSGCTMCPLNFSRKLSVPGEGPANAEILFIGEGPGFYENEQGRPFVGAAGKFLDELLASIGFKRSDVFITNVVKCRPPGNRDPEPIEMEACNKYLDRQIQALNPKVIVTLGRFSMSKFMPNVRISDVHGQASVIKGRTVIAMYHPAAALHQPALKATVQQDFSHIPELIRKNKPAVEAAPAPGVHQAPPGVHQAAPDVHQAPPEEPKSEPKVEPKQLTLF